MICIIEFDLSDEIVGWIIAIDIDDARRQAQASDNLDLAAILYRMTFTPPRGQYPLSPRVTMLVS